MRFADSLALRTLLAERPPAYCPEARHSGWLLRDNYDFGVTVAAGDLPTLFSPVYANPGSARSLPSNGEWQTYMDLDQGHHVVEPASADSDGRSPAMIDLNPGWLKLVARPTIDDAGKTLIGSGLIRAFKTVRYGFIETRFFCRGGPTLWPACWLLPADAGNSWPPEIDLLDSPINRDPGRETSQLVHLGVVASPTQRDQITTSLLDQWSNYRAPGLDWTLRAVTIGLYWLGDQVAHYVDGKLVRSGTFDWKRGDGSDPGNAWLVWNLAIGGKWPGVPCRATFSETGGSAFAAIDYLRYWCAP